MSTAVAKPRVGTEGHRPGQYPDYSETGLEWLPLIPRHWTMEKLKYIAQVQFSNVDKKSEEGEVAVRLCNYVDVYYNDRITSEIEFMEATADPREIAKFQVQPGDVLATKDSEDPNDICVPAVVGESLPGVLCGYHLAQVRPLPGISWGGYIMRAFASCGVRDQFRKRANGITRFGLSQDAVCSALFPVPPLEEQMRIADWLDDRTKRIDELVAAKRRLIDLLAEQRTALITKAVTKGLNPDASMKPSGIDWLGDVPSHWEVKPLKYLVSKIGSGKTPKGGAEVYVSDGVMLLRSQNIYDDGLRLEDVVFIDDETDAEMAGTRVFPGDVLFNITGASIGRVSIVPSNMPPANVNQHVCIIRTHRILPSYLHAFLCSKVVKDWIDSQENGTSREGLNFRQIGSMHLPLPSAEEQQELIAFIDRSTAAIDAMFVSVKEAIARLEEYRQSLITAAVTGKIDVRKGAIA